MPAIHEALLVHITSEYLEMPGLQLTHEQARRLWALDDVTCGRVLESLVARKFLVRGTDAQYRRASDGIVADLPKRTAKATLAAPDIARRIG